MPNRGEFFLLVEGGRIDWCNHMNDAASSLAELEDFEEAIVEALRFLKRHPKETLVIVIADHGTGGMQKSTKQPLQKPLQTSSYERFLHQLETAPKNENALLDLCSLTWGKDPSFFARDVVCCQLLQEFFFHQDGKTLWMQLARRMNEEWGISWTTTGHTGEDVPLFVWGEGAERFRKAQKNIDIAHILKNLLEECVVQEERF
ncbi:MAG: alkaline phosphatase [Candidatus Caldatribacteriaceae bacterium]